VKSVVALCVLLSASSAFGFCGFYVGKAGTELFNQASKVVLVRSENRTVITMSSDYQGALKDFALVVPVPEVLERKQIHVGDPKVIDHLDEYTAPRLVEYHDQDPCAPQIPIGARGYGGDGMVGDPSAPAKKMGVKVEAEYEVGEYDILILSAKESAGLVKWLVVNGYKMPKGAGRVLGSYIKQDLKFFVAKVNIERQAKEGVKFLRPLQIAYESQRFELPIRLGTVNSKGFQDLFVFALTDKGRVETTNYQNKKLPTGMTLPVFVKNDFGTFYKDMFTKLAEQDEMKHVYTEYAWDMAWCDPCAADPLSYKELRSLGVFWAAPAQSSGRSQNVFVTRMHARYTEKSFPQDLKFQVTNDRNNFQGRYVLQHPYTGKSRCDLRVAYDKKLVTRQEERAQQLANLTGWPIASIRSKMKLTGQPDGDKSWIDNLWGD
jgi:hypothetical protein